MPDLLTDLDKQSQDREFLTDGEQYAQYFSLLSRMSSLLQKYYLSADAGDSQEAKVVSSFLDRLIYTMGVLRLKYSYQNEHSHPLWVDLTDSGFPNCEELHTLRTDLHMRIDRLRDIPASMLLKRRMFDQMLREGTEPVELLSQMSERAYLEMLDESKLFLPFTPGELTKRESKDPNRRSYVFSWACYDYLSNRPYIHLMMFEQDSDAEPLEDNGKTYAEFIGVLQTEGSRAPDVGILAMAVDDALESIHPKLIKRICIGPLYSPILLDHRVKEEVDERERVLREVFASDVVHEDDEFALFFKCDIVFSQRSMVSKGLLSLSKRVREIFHIPQDDFECAIEQASAIQRYVLIPHSLLQVLSTPLYGGVTKVSTSKPITFNRKGEIHAV